MWCLKRFYEDLHKFKFQLTFSFRPGSRREGLRTCNTYHHCGITKLPDMQDNVREEISNIVSNFEDLIMEQLNDLLYTDAFIKESLRLFIPTPHNARVATKDCKFDNVSAPKGTTIMTLNLHILKNEFEKGEEFALER